MAERHATGIVSFFVRHRNAANLLMIMLVLFGVVAAGRLNTQFFPTVEQPRITINVTWPGASAEDVETNILDSLEPAVRFVDNVKEIKSYAREGAASILIEFDQGSDMQKAVADVESGVNGVTTLPEDTEDPRISQRIWYESVAKLNISGPFSEKALKTYAKQLRDGLLDAGIDRVDFEGFRDEEVWILVEERELRRLGLTLSDIAGRVSASVRDLPSGTLKARSRYSSVR